MEEVARSDEDFNFVDVELHPAIKTTAMIRIARTTRLDSISPSIYPTDYLGFYLIY
jgi:hypothetical protein